jgi:hypothetical protein
MLSSYAKQLLLGVLSAARLMASPFAAHAGEVTHFPPHEKTNINLAVASNFYGVPPSNSAIADLINAFEAANPHYTVTVVDNGATATLASRIINGNALKVDLFLAADTETPFDLLTKHFDLVAPYNSSLTPARHKAVFLSYLRACLPHSPYQGHCIGLHSGT